ncbi:MAG: VCBS repeat domain-containing M23 family metallopeptidase [Candidatus Andersenbacteria bacterium]
MWRTTLSALLLVALPRIGLGAADIWQYPLNNWSYVSQYGQGFGEQNPYFNNWYHLAQDTNVSRTPTGTKVYAPADGKVRFASTASGYGCVPCGGNSCYGYVVVIEHTLSDGSKVCSTLGHVQGGAYNPSAQTGLVPAGSTVARGQYIARVADYMNCPPTQNWHHLHFGIRKGGYSWPECVAGYTPTPAGLNSWWEPNGFIAAHQGTPPPPSCQPGSFVYLNRAGDFNGDGRMDIAKFYCDTGRWDVLLSTGSSFVQQTWFAQGHGTHSDWQGVGDMNGDGRYDAFAYFDSDGNVYCALSNGTGFNNWYKATSAPIWQHAMENKFFGDVDGDGRDDFIGYVNGNWYVALSDGVHFGWPQWGILGHGTGSTKRLVRDVTGDGRVDAFAYFAQDDSWYGAAGQPDGTFGTSYGLWAVGHGDASNDQLLGDIDGNGAADAWAFWHQFGSWPGYVTVWNSYGLGAGGFHVDNNPRTQGQASGSTLRIAADFTGDRRDDLAYLLNGSWYVAASDGYSLWPASKWK